MKKKHLMTATVVGIAMMFVGAGILAAACQEVIKLEDKEYTEYTKGVVEFHHQKHSEEYAKKFPDVYKRGCGECHHDKDNKPLTNITCDDKVQKCIECHSKPGEKPKGKDAPKLSKKEELQYHAEAMHDNCRECHKNYNKQYKTKNAPTTCTKCHPKKAGEKE